MITEDYVSFEVAKLLKEKGFKEFTYTFYSKDDYDAEPVFDRESLCSDNWNGQPDEVNDLWYSAPTIQMAMKWLRKTHNIFIEVSVDEMLKDEGYQWSLYYDDTKQIRPYSGWEETPEEACEAALKYALKNLI